MNLASVSVGFFVALLAVAIFGLGFSMGHETTCQQTAHAFALMHQEAVGVELLAQVCK